jgi:hypothetical protein
MQIPYSWLCVSQAEKNPQFRKGPLLNSPKLSPPLERKIISVETTVATSICRAGAGRCSKRRSTEPNQTAAMGAKAETAHRSRGLFHVFDCICKLLHHFTLREESLYSESAMLSAMLSTVPHEISPPIRDLIRPRLRTPPPATDSQHNATRW